MSSIAPGPNAQSGDISRKNIFWSTEAVAGSSLSSNSCFLDLILAPVFVFFFLQSPPPVEQYHFIRPLHYFEIEIFLKLFVE